ncbi:MAG: hypothetical protein ACI9MC_000898 [Kiritimatiellia bacterium]|jgi:hypothetical protein
MSKRGLMLIAVLALAVALTVGLRWWQLTPVHTAGYAVIDDVIVRTPSPQLESSTPPVAAPEPLTFEEKEDLVGVMELLAPDKAVVTCAIPEPLQHLAPLRSTGPFGMGRVPWLHSEGGVLFASIPPDPGRERLLHQGSTVGWLAWKDGACSVQQAQFTQVNGVVLEGQSPVEHAIIRGCERGAVVRTEADGRFAFRLARGQRCQPVVARRVDGTLWFELPERLNATDEEVLDLVWQAPGPDAGRTVVRPDGSLEVSQIEAMRAVMLDKLDGVQLVFEGVPPDKRAVAQPWADMASDDRDRVLTPLDELLEPGVSVERFEDYFLLGEAMF